MGLSEMVQLGYPFIRGDTNLSLSISVGVFVGSTEINMNSGVNHKTASRCEEKMGSHCSSNPCPDYSTCQEEFDSYKCICPVGYVGKHCLRVCSLKPCRHGKCESTNHGKGFRCVCPQQYTGKWNFFSFFIFFFFFHLKSFPLGHIFFAICGYHFNPYKVVINEINK